MVPAADGAAPRLKAPSGRELSPQATEGACGRQSEGHKSLSDLHNANTTRSTTIQTVCMILRISPFSFHRFAVPLPPGGRLNGGRWTLDGTAMPSPTARDEIIFPPVLVAPQGSLREGALRRRTRGTVTRPPHNICHICPARTCVFAPASPHALTFSATSPSPAESDMAVIFSSKPSMRALAILSSTSRSMVRRRFRAP